MAYTRLAASASGPVTRTNAVKRISTLHILISSPPFLSSGGRATSPAGRSTVTEPSHVARWKGRVKPGLERRVATPTADGATARVALVIPAAQLELLVGEVGPGDGLGETRSDKPSCCFHTTSTYRGAPRRRRGCQGHRPAKARPGVVVEQAHAGPKRRGSHSSTTLATWSGWPTSGARGAGQDRIVPDVDLGVDVGVVELERKRRQRLGR